MRTRTILDNIFSALTHSKVNRKQIFVATIGLLISLSIVSSASIFVDSQKNVLIEQMIESDFPQELIINYESDIELQENKNPLINHVNDSLIEFGFDDEIKKISRSSGIYQKFILTSNSSKERQGSEWYVIRQIIGTKTFDFSFFSPYAIKPIMDSDLKGNILINVYDEFFNPTIEEISLNLTYEFIDSFGYERARKIISLSNIINISRNELENMWEIYPEARYTWFRGNTLIINDFTSFFEEKDIDCGFYQNFYIGKDNETQNRIYLSQYNFTATSNSPPCKWNVVTSNSIRYEFDLSKFDLFDVSTTIRNLEEFEISLQNKFNDLGYYSSGSSIFNVRFDNNFLWFLRSLESFSIVLFTAIMLFTFPIIIVAIFLAYYSFGLIQRNALQRLNVYLTKGISRIQYFSFLIFEMIISLFIAISFAIILSIPITSLSLKSSDFFEFNSFLDPVISLFQLLELLIQFGIIFALLVNVLRIIKMTRIDIAEVEKIIVEERNPPFWRRKYLDILMLVFGLLFYGLTIYSIEFEVFLPAEFYLILSLPSPLLIIVGSVMVTSRLFSPITNKIGTFLWQNYGSLSSFSLKNTVKHRHSSTRALILISLTLAFALSFLIFPFSFISYGENSTHYRIGAEIVVGIDLEDVNETRINQILSNFSDQIEAYSPVLNIELENQRMLVINSTTFSQVAWMREDFIQNLDEKLQLLSSENNSILLYYENIAVSGLDIGDTFVWTSQYQEQEDENRNNTLHPFKIQGEFYYWPALINRVPWEPQRQFYGVIDFNTYYDLNNSLGEEADIAIYNEKLKLYIKPGSTLNHTFFKESLEQLEDVIYVDSYPEQIKELKNNLIFLLIVGQINSNVIYSILIIVIILGMFGFKQLIERSKEIATERAIGMTLMQTFKVFLIETLWILVFSIILGVIFGLVFSSLFLLGLTQGPTFPPFVMVFPWHLISIMVLILISLGILLSFIPAYLSSQLEINKLLKVE